MHLFLKVKQRHQRKLFFIPLSGCCPKLRMGVYFLCKSSLRSTFEEQLDSPFQSRVLDSFQVFLCSCGPSYRSQSFLAPFAWKTYFPTRIHSLLYLSRPGFTFSACLKSPSLPPWQPAARSPSWVSLPMCLKRGIVFLELFVHSFVFHVRLQTPEGESLFLSFSFLSQYLTFSSSSTMNIY